MLTPKYYNTKYSTTKLHAPEKKVELFFVAIRFLVYANWQNLSP